MTGYRIVLGVMNGIGAFLMSAILAFMFLGIPSILLYAAWVSGNLGVVGWVLFGFVSIMGFVVLLATFHGWLERKVEQHSREGKENG